MARMSHRWATTYRSPSTTSDMRRSPESASRGSGRVRISRIINAENANVPPSKTNAQPSQGRDEKTSDQRSEQHHGERPHELGQRVGLDEQIPGNDRGHDGREGRLEDGLPDPVHDDQPDHQRDG